MINYEVDMDEIHLELCMCELGSYDKGRGGEFSEIRK